MRGGAQAHLMRCSDGGYYVVKFQNNPQGARILANEMLGGALATRLGLPTPQIAIVDVRSSLIEGSEELVVQLGRGRFPCSPGLCFGSQYAADARPSGTRVLQWAHDFLPLDELSRVTNLVDFAGMLVFDKWTCNTDGRQVVFVHGAAPSTYNVVMIDNGFCFNATEWNFPDAPLRGLYAQPYAYESVLGIESFEPWLQLLESGINKQWLAETAAEIPREWYVQTTNTLAALLDKLERRRASVGELLRSACAGAPRHFRNWSLGRWNAQGA
jgi:HipA-like protein